MKDVKKMITALAAAAALVLTGIALPAGAESEFEESNFAVIENEVPELTEDTPIPAAAMPMFSLPADMRAAVITPSVDYFTDDEEDASALRNELDNIYSEFAELGLNAVVINSMNGDDAFYSLDSGSSGCNPVLEAVISAYECGLSPYVVFDIGYALSDCRSGADAIDTLVSKAHRFAAKYQCSGIILDDYYVRRNVASFGDYMANGSGIGYGNWLYDAAEQYFRTASDVIHNTDNSIAVGFVINDMWANSSVNSEGSETADSTQAYYDGHADTKSFIENGYVDFAVVRAYGSTISPTLPFEKVAGWWGAVTGSCGIPLYILHHNEFVGSEKAGWGAADQLLKQLTVSKQIMSYSGSVFNSFAALEEDRLGSTTAVKSYFNEQIDEETLFEDLKITSPANLTFTTTEATVAFMGTFDSNFPVLFNGEEIRLNDAGNFYFEKQLDDGLNTFTISHKDKTLTYNITRKITVLKSIGSAIADGKTLKVDGGTKIKLSARAYKGASVYGTVNGTTVTMTESESTDEDELNSSYVRYTGTYTVPEGKVGETRDLGSIKIYASYGGYSMGASGAKVTVNAKPEPVKKTEVVMADAADVGSGEVLATLAPAGVSSGSVKYVRTLYDNTIVYDGKTADDIPSPLFSQLPAGTLEVFRSESGSYYVTESGKRIAASASSLEDGAAITENALYVKSVGTSGGNGFIKIKLDHKTGFNMRLAGNSYYTAWDGDYNVSNFTATHLYITFENVTSVTALPSFEHNQVFSSGKWDTVTEENGTKFRLILELRQPGVYFGHAAKYDSSGDLVLSFPVPVNSLSGLTVVIDPGHGYGKSASVLDPGAIGEVVEQEVVLAISKELESQLKAAGANVVRLKTESEFLLTKDRPNTARAYGCDIYISVHANKALGDARGAEAYYFTSYSEPLAAEISKGIAAYYRDNVYSDGADRDRGARYSYYHVTLQQDFPSVLVETGFVDNIQDAMALASETHRKGIAAGIVSGIRNYLARSSVSYASDGVSVAGSSAAAATLPAVTSAPAAAAAASSVTTTTKAAVPAVTAAQAAVTASSEDEAAGTVEADAETTLPAQSGEEGEADEPDDDESDSEEEDEELPETTEPEETDDPAEEEDMPDGPEEDPDPTDADTTASLTDIDTEGDDIDDLEEEDE